MTVAIMNPKIKDGKFIPYNKTKLKECIEQLISSDMAYKFIMCYFNEAAVEVMCELKTSYPTLDFFIINTCTNCDNALSTHYIQLGGYENKKDVAISALFNMYFYENYNLLIYPTKDSVAVIQKG